MRKIYPAVSVDRKIANDLFREVRESDEEDEDENKDEERERERTRTKETDTRNEDPTSVFTLDFKQISLLADGIQSPFPLAAEEATSHGSRSRLGCKTQSLLP
jgi:hypothetical protein